MLRKWLFFSVVATFLVIMIVTLIAKVATRKAFYYTAYAIEYDESYVIKLRGHVQLGDTVLDRGVHAIIISPYIK